MTARIEWLMGEADGLGTLRESSHLRSIALVQAATQRLVQRHPTAKFRTPALTAFVVRPAMMPGIK